ncbi:relaxin-3 [Ascaphus truei]|uniref:relaxin-3 n=1 Tax=Ascaphus truei TaxID=8439 RepID=UPI003F5A59B9
MQCVTPAVLTALWLLAWQSGALAGARAPAFGVKLCGREFIRAVIFTCGGSRWRRADGGQAGDPVDVFGSLVPGDSEEEAFSEWAGSLRPYNSDLPDYGSPQSWRDPPAVRHGAGGAGEEPLRGSERRGREAALGLSNTCCKWGCSKSQISSLC